MKRAYTDEDAAHALAVLKSNRGNAKKTAIALGIPRTTLRQWAGRAKSDTAHPKQVSPEAYAAATGDLGKKFLEIASKGTEIQLAALQSVDPKKMSMLDVKNLATTTGIAIDKHQSLVAGPEGRADRTIHIVYGVDSSISSLRELGERTVSAQLGPGNVLEGEVLSQSESVVSGSRSQT